MWLDRILTNVQTNLKPVSAAMLPQWYTMSSSETDNGQRCWVTRMDSVRAVHSLGAHMAICNWTTSPITNSHVCETTSCALFTAPLYQLLLLYLSMTRYVASPSLGTSTPGLTRMNLVCGTKFGLIRWHYSQCVMQNLLIQNKCFVRLCSQKPAKHLLL